MTAMVIILNARAMMTAQHMLGIFSYDELSQGLSTGRPSSMPPCAWGAGGLCSKGFEAALRLDETA